MTWGLRPSLPEGWRPSGRAGLSSPGGLRFSSKARAIQHLAPAGDWSAVQLVKDLCVTSEGFQAAGLPAGWLGKGDSGG